MASVKVRRHINISNEFIVWLQGEFGEGVSLSWIIGSLTEGFMDAYKKGKNTSESISSSIEHAVDEAKEI